jgi:RNA polymerase sigma factor (sigma-70 family)
MLDENGGKMKAFLENYKEELENPVIKNFLKQEENYNLLVQAISCPNNENKERLNVEFQEYYAVIRLTHYISMMIHHYARDYYLRLKKNSNFHQLILDKPSKEGDSSAATLVELLGKDNGEVMDILLGNSKSLLEVITDQKLFKLFKELSERQQLILNLFFIYQMNLTEISKVLGISQQAVSKTFNKTLEKLKSLMEEDKFYGIS